MMFQKKNQGFKLAAFLVASMFVFMSYTFNPPNGKSGAPGEGTCRDCHSVSNDDIDGLFTITGLPDQITPGEQYRLTLTTEVFTSNSTRSGFQMVALDNNNEKAGTLSNESANTVIIQHQGKEYLEHVPAGTVVDDKITWEVDWLAPDLEDGSTITFYAMNLIANSDGLTSGDKVLKLQDQYVVMKPSSVIDSDISNLISVYPNPAQDHFRIQNDAQSTFQAITLIGMDGTIIKNFNPNQNRFDLNEVRNGLYFIQLKQQENTLVKKLLVSK